MRTLQRCILLPVDFSERSAGAACYAKSLAVHFQSELTPGSIPAPSRRNMNSGRSIWGGSVAADLYRNSE